MLKYMAGEGGRESGHPARADRPNRHTVLECGGNPESFRGTPLSKAWCH